MKENDGNMTVAGYFFVQVVAAAAGYGLARGVGFLGKKVAARFKARSEVQAPAQVQAQAAPVKGEKGKKPKAR